MKRPDKKYESEGSITDQMEKGLDAARLPQKNHSHTHYKWTSVGEKSKVMTMI